MAAMNHPPPYTDDDVALLYPILNRWGESDAFYLRHLMAAHDVLDVGCGPGTLLHRARTDGHTGRLVGVDPDLAALRIARQRANIDWLEATAAAMPWHHEFDLAVMTGHAFQSLITDHDVHDSLTAIHRAQRPGGTFIFETRNPVLREWESWAASEPFAIVDHRGDQVEIRYQILKLTNDVVTLTETTATPDGHILRVDEGQLRFLSLADLDAALSNAGFTFEQRFGDWSGTPFQPDSPEIITIARPI